MKAAKLLGELAFHSPHAVFKFICACLVTLLFFAASAMAQHGTAQDQPKSQPRREITDAEKRASWTGEKVILIDYPSIIYAEDQKVYFGGGLRTAHKYDKPGEALPRGAYNRKTGVVLETEEHPDYPFHRLVILLDETGEKVSVDDEYVGFFAEKQVAEKLVGQTFWVKHLVTLTTGEQKLVVYPATRLTVTRVDPGLPTNPVFLHMQTQDGREGSLVFPCGTCLDPRFHTYHAMECTLLGGAPYPTGVCVEPLSLEWSFYLEDPRKLHPKWNEDTWKLIRQGIVAIGMTEEMAKFACGEPLAERGAVLSSSGEAGLIYECRGKQFLVAGGRVTKYVDEK